MIWPHLLMVRMSGFHPADRGFESPWGHQGLCSKVVFTHAWKACDPSRGRGSIPPFSAK